MQLDVDSSSQTEPAEQSAAAASSATGAATAAGTSAVSSDVAPSFMLGALPTDRMSVTQRACQPFRPHDTLGGVSRPAGKKATASAKQSIAELEEIMAQCAVDIEKSKGFAPGWHTGLELEMSEAEGEDYRRPRANETDADNDERDQHRKRKKPPFMDV